MAKPESINAPWWVILCGSSVAKYRYSFTTSALSYTMPTQVFSKLERSIDAGMTS